MPIGIISKTWFLALKYKSLKIRDSTNNWKKLCSYIKGQNNKNTGISPLRSEGLLYTDTLKKENILNEQFKSAFTFETNTVISDKGPPTHPIVDNIDINREGIYKLIKNINPKKATRPDNITGIVIKENINTCTDIFTLFFTKSIHTGKVPHDWNHANVTPVFKIGDKHHPGNYRPISLACISCKLLEHIIASNIMKHFESNNILYDLQHGFRAHRSCESQIISLIHQLSLNNDKNIQTNLIIMDFAKAFDKVPHNRLLFKL